MAGVLPRDRSLLGCAVCASPRIRAQILGMIGRIVGALMFVSIAATAQEKPTKSPSPASQPEPTAPVADESQAKKKKKAKPGRGYTWSDKRRPRGKVRRVKKRAKRAVHRGPKASFPSFRLLPDGRTLVFVKLDRRVNVQVRRARGRATYVLSGARVEIRNDTRPLLTHYFPTPLSSLRLLRDGEGAQLILDLREDVIPKHRLRSGRRGKFSILEVTLPKPKAPPPPR